MDMVTTDAAAEVTIGIAVTDGRCDRCACY
jgi:hypothetical protein